MKNLKRDQRGLASIVVIIVIISVLTIIVTGFAGIIRREQRQSLDQQLAAQARYAAESEINKKIAEFRKDPEAFINSINNNQCNEQGQTFPDSSAEIQTTCVLVETDKGDVQHDSVDTNEPTVIWLDPGTALLDRLVVTWENPETVPDNRCPDADYKDLFPNLVDSRDIGQLRYDLVKVGLAGQPITRDGLRKGIMGGVLQPRKGSGRIASLGYTTDPARQPLVFGSCESSPPNVDKPYKAHATFQMTNTSDRYMLRLTGIYRPSRIKVAGFDANNKQIIFKDSQIVLEATAIVSNVPQRVQITIPRNAAPGDFQPDSALHITEGVCKRVQTEPSSTTNSC